MKNERYKNCFPYYGCYILGPTGSTGPQGPATINVGNTENGLPGTNAMVVNSGTNENVTLDFVIPQGATGPAPSLEIGSVVTGLPGTQASVSITKVEDNQK